MREVSGNKDSHREWIFLPKKSWKLGIFLILFFLFPAFPGCSTAGYARVERAEPTPEWGPAEIAGTVELMVGSVQDYFNRSREKPFIELVKIQNKSSEHIDTGMLANEIATNLIKKKIVFIDRRERIDAIKEIEMGQKGMVNSASQIQAGEFVSPNFKLSGEISDNVRYDGSNKIQYIVVTLRLLKLSTGTIEWQEEKKFLKITKKERVGW